MKDFFTAYKSANIRKYVSSTLIALTLSVTVVSALNQAGPRGLLLANVLQAGSPEIVNYTADLMIERHDRTIDLRLGKEAYDVDGLSLTLLGDPEKFLALHSPDSSVTITSSESGVFLVKMTRNTTHILAGDILMSLTSTISGETSIAPVDAVLTSAGQSYTLSIQEE